MASAYRRNPRVSVTHCKESVTTRPQPRRGGSPAPDLAVQRVALDRDPPPGRQEGPDPPNFCLVSRLPPRAVEDLLRPDVPLNAVAPEVQPARASGHAR